MDYGVTTRLGLFLITAQTYIIFPIVVYWCFAALAAATQNEASDPSKISPFTKGAAPIDLLTDWPKMTQKGHVSIRGNI